LLYRKNEPGIEYNSIIKEEMAMEILQDIKVFGGPNRYIQGPDIIKNVGSYILSFELGNNILGIIDKMVFSSIKEDLSASLNLQNFNWVAVKFGGECTEKEINRLIKITEAKNINLILGAGGGKTLDTSKAVARKIGAPLILLPTIAASDAACSSLSVLYDDNGKFYKAIFFNKSPELVLVDSKIISLAPVRFLVSGMGDALSTGYEAQACYKGKGKNSFNGEILSSVLNLAKLCSETILKHGLKAKIAVENDLLTKDVEIIIEANLFLSTIGFESGGLAAAHAIADGFTFRRETHKFLHGEKVAFGLITQLIMEGKSVKLLKRILDFYHSVGLPICLEQIGLKKYSNEDILEIAKKACRLKEPIHNMSLDINEYLVKDSLIMADGIGKRYLDGKF